MNMVFCKIHFCLIFLLVFCLMQSSFGFVPTPEQNRCINEIKHDFSADNEKIYTLKFYAKQAFLNLRISNVPTKHTFTSNDAMVYYLTSIFNFIEIGDSVKDPITFCNQSNDSDDIGIMTGDDGRIIETNNGRCMFQLMAYVPMLGKEHRMKVLRTIYYNIVIKEIPITDNFAIDYLLEVAKKFLVNNQRKCIKDIKHDFSVLDKKTLKRKNYAKEAFLNLRISNDPNERLFKNDDAKEYYENHILPFIIIGSNIEDPVSYCSNFINSDCTDHLQRYMPMVGKDKLTEVIDAIYKNVVFKDIPKELNFARTYIDGIATNFTTDKRMPYPAEFCKKKHRPVKKLKP